MVLDYLAAGLSSRHCADERDKHDLLTAKDEEPRYGTRTVLSRQIPRLSLIRCGVLGPT